MQSSGIGIHVTNPSFRFADETERRGRFRAMSKTSSDYRWENRSEGLKWIPCFTEASGSGLALQHRVKHIGLAHSEGRRPRSVTEHR